MILFSQNIAAPELVFLMAKIETCAIYYTLRALSMCVYKEDGLYARLSVPFLRIRLGSMLDRSNLFMLSVTSENVHPIRRTPL